MYCSTCGGAVAKGLSYCKHCGARLDGANGDGARKLTGMTFESLVWANAGIALGGIGAIIALIAVMKFNQFGSDVTIAFAILSFLMLMGVESVFVRLLWRSINLVKEASDPAQVNEYSTKELSGTPARALNEPAASVTENTTRTLEPAYRERKSND